MAITMSLVGCDDYDYDRYMSTPEIVSAFTVKSSTGNTYKAVIDGDNITIKVNPYADIDVELSDCLPTFIMSMGATCTPAPYEPQDFTKEVRYTITSGDGKHQRVYTVNWGPSDKLPVGEGYAASRILAEKTFTELGYPGQVFNYYQPMHLRGDLLLSVGFCGPDRVVGYSRVYGWGTTEVDPTPEQAIKIWDATTLRETGEKLNLGEISTENIINVTNDWKGHLVAAVGGLNSTPSDIYYWKSVSEPPVKVGRTPVPVYFNNHSLDANSGIDVAGDITGNAAISYLAVRSSNGDHHVVYVKGGQISSSGTITTGFPSNDPSWFQMISLFGPDENASYLVGDTEGEKVNGSIKGYYQTAAGLTLGAMAGYMNGVAFSDGIVCWSSTGQYMTRGGARRPFMMAMVLNGKEYSLCLTGYDWENFNVMMNGDMSQFINDALTYDNRAYMLKVKGEAGLINYDSFGSCGCWYWDDELQEGKVATWISRCTLTTFGLHCYE